MLTNNKKYDGPLCRSCCVDPAYQDCLRDRIWSSLDSTQNSAAPRPALESESQGRRRITDRVPVGPYEL